MPSRLKLPPSLFKNKQTKIYVCVCVYVYFFNFMTTNNTYGIITGQAPTVVVEILQIVLFKMTQALLDDSLMDQTIISVGRTGVCAGLFFLRCS